MATRDPVKCKCRNNCVRPPGREGSNTRGTCPCYQNGTVCTYLCSCGRGKVECLNTIDAHLEEEAALYFRDDATDECDEEPTPFAIFFRDHDGEVTVNAEDILNTSTQDVAAAQAHRDASFVEEDDEEAQPLPQAKAKPKTKKRAAKDQYKADVAALKLKIRDLPTVGMTRLVLKLAELYPDLVEMAMEPPPEPPGPGTAPGWCNCDMCRQMPTTQEQLCCCLLPGGTCILLDEATRGPINQMVLSRRALEVAVYNHNEYCAQQDDPNNNDTMRHMAYRKFVLWHRGYLGAGVRVVIPSCVVWAIRDQYPSVDGTYTGFIPSQIFV